MEEETIKTREANSSEFSFAGGKLEKGEQSPDGSSPTGEVAVLSHSYVEKESLDMTEAKPKRATVSRKADNLISQRIYEMFDKISQ
eukprot:IDg12633t1